MRRFIDEPERYQREFESVGQFLTEQAAGQEPTYGQTSAAYMRQIGSDIGAGK